ncbi:MAG: magnesium and cobalt transport protein CorA [Pseudoclavibacter sp.]
MTPLPRPNKRRLGLARQKVGQPGAARQRTPGGAGAGDCHVRYVVDGEFVEAPSETTARDALEFADDRDDAMAMLLFPTPTEADVTALAEAWNLHPLLVEDLMQGGQRPKLERYGSVLSVVAKAAVYDDEAEEVRLAEFHLLTKGRAVALFCQDDVWLDGTIAAEYASHLDDLTADSLFDGSLLAQGPEAVVYRLVDAIVDGYSPVLAGLEIDREEIELQVFGGSPDAAERIYRLNREVFELVHASTSLDEVLQALRRGHDRYGVTEPMQSYLEDVADHLTIVRRRVFELRDALAQILTVNTTLVAQRQNEDMKKISGWAAVLFAPSLIGAIYGMNFDVMPELHWAFGYPLAIAAMLILAVVLYLLFKRKNWM